MSDPAQQASAGYQQAVIGAPPVAAPTPKSQEMVFVRRSELHGLKRTARRAFADPAASASAWAFTWLGVGIAAALSLLAMVAPKGQHIRTWVLEAHVFFIVLGFF